ncbi:hypothetical protein ACOMHN_034439 [Nucella lapillus]
MFRFGEGWGSAVATLVVALCWALPADARKTLCYQGQESEQSIYDFDIMDVHKERKVNLSSYEGQILLLVNYLSLNALETDLDGFHVLGVPCNQFGKQEPGGNGTEILNSLKYVRPGNGFLPAFNLTEKVEVNGQNEHPLYTYLKSYCPPVDDIFHTAGPGIYYSPYRNSDVRWNFEKFLIDRQGKPVLRYHTHYQPDDIRADIIDMLSKPETFDDAQNFF